MIVRPVRSSQSHVRVDERLAADLAARRALGDELLLDDVLRRDAGVVVAGLPERVEPPHPVPADQDVLHRAVQRVPHVELAGDVRRRDADHEGVVPAAARAGGVEAFRLPGLLPAPLDAVRTVERVHGGEVYGSRSAAPPSCAVRIPLGS